MKTPEDIAKVLLDSILAAPSAGSRKLVAIAGPPASGKSTVAAKTASLLNAEGYNSKVVPMDGFHLDNSILEKRGLLAPKGAPDTFDGHGFCRLVSALSCEQEVIVPLFDRQRDIAIAGADVVSPDCNIVLVEGNYLLLDEDPWRKLARFWDVSVWLDVQADTLEARLLERWLEHGLSLEMARERALGNDLVNANYLTGRTMPADVSVSM